MFNFQLVNVATQTDKEACFDLEVRVKKTESCISIPYIRILSCRIPHAANHKTHAACVCRMPRVIRIQAMGLHGRAA